MQIRSAIAKVNKRGMLLVFPIHNRKEPPSLWSEFWPRSKMRWEWDQDGDNRVSELWHLREQLSRSGKVVYCKWFRGRATLISRSLFPPMLRMFGSHTEKPQGLSFRAQEMLDALNEDCPLSTKQLKLAVDLRGREFERIYEASMKELWSRLLIVAYGEVDEGAFPSIAVGTTRAIFEDLWNESRELSEAEAHARVEGVLLPGSPFFKFYQEMRRQAAERSSYSLVGAP